MPDGPARVARAAPGDGDRNRLAVVPGPLCFTISRYRDYKSYGWSRFYPRTDYGEIGRGGGYRGDPQAVEAMSEGYVYVYRREGSSYSLWKVFTVSSGQYQEVDARGATVDYGSNRGAARDHAHIEGYFPGEHGIPPAIVIIDSDIRLTEGRLRGQPYSLDRDPRARGWLFQNSRSRMRDAPENPPSGPDVLQAYRNRRDTPDLVTYNFALRDFGGEVGMDIRRPHAFAEAERRSAIYRERVETHQVWLDDEERNKQAYIHQTIVAVIRRDSDREGQLDMDRLRQWKRDDTEQYRLHFFPVHYGVQSLLDWLEDPLLREWLIDYNRSDDDDIQEAGLGAYVTGILDLSLSGRGREYLEAQFDDDASFFNLATHIPEIRRNYTDPDAHSNFAVEVRKVSNVTFAGLQEFGGLIVKNGSTTDTARRLATWANARGANLAVREGRAARMTSRALGHVDVDALERWARGAANFTDSFKGRSIITCFEVINLGIAIKGVADAYRTEGGNGTNLFFNLLNAAGATADIAASGVLERYTQRVVQRAGWASGRIYYLAVFSGLVDLVVGVRSAGQEWASGDYDTAVGWGVFSVGGAIVAVGGYMQITGATVTVGSGGTAVVPGGAVILLGFVVEALGLVWVWLANDDELDEWLIRSRFGRRPGFSTLDREIEALNTLMCKFEVDAEFPSDTHARVIIRPRLYTEDSTLELTRVHSDAEGRMLEHLFGDRDDVVTGMQGLGEFTVDGTTAARRVSFERSGGRVTAIKIEFYGRQDIDAIRGHARLNIGPGGYIHGYVAGRSAAVEVLQRRAGLVATGAALVDPLTAAEGIEGRLGLVTLVAVDAPAVEAHIRQAGLDPRDGVGRIERPKRQRVAVDQLWILGIGLDRQ